MAGLAMGIDGWKGRWVAVVLDEGAFSASVIGDRIAALLERFPSVVAVGIDMPIGFPITEPRRADIVARTFVGPRRSSVFPMLPKSVYETDSYAEAAAECQRLWGRGLSKQSYALKKPIMELAALAESDGRICEAHPEVSFAAMAGQPLQWSKKCWNGQLLRSRLLREQGVVLPADLGEAGGVPVDDVLDAAACAWSAQRAQGGDSLTLPTDPAPGEPTIVY